MWDEGEGGTAQAPPREGCYHTRYIRAPLTGDAYNVGTLAPSSKPHHNTTIGGTTLGHTPRIAPRAGARSAGTRSAAPGLGRHRKGGAATERASAEQRAPNPGGSTASGLQPAPTNGQTERTGGWSGRWARWGSASTGRAAQMGGEAEGPSGVWARPGSGSEHGQSVGCMLGGGPGSSPRRKPSGGGRALPAPPPCPQAAVCFFPCWQLVPDGWAPAQSGCGARSLRHAWQPA